MTANIQTQRTLLAVRIWSVYLTSTMVILGLSFFTISGVSPILLLLVPLAVLRLIDLWRLRSLGRTSALSLLIVHVFAPVLYLFREPTSLITLGLAISAVPIGIDGLIFFNRPAVVALFQNQQSTIQNQQS